VSSYASAMQDLTGKVAVVTGAASGIGLALSEMFVAEGMRAVLADIDERRLAEAADSLASRGAEVASVVCDTSSEAQVNELAEQTLRRFGSAHVLCNNAGIAGGGDAWIGPMDEWTRVVGVNLYGVVHGIRAFLPIMTEQQEGHIVNTASMAGLLSMPGMAPYNVTKHGVVALSEGLYLELKSTGSPVEVSVLCPGWVKTRIMEHEATVSTTPMASFIAEVARSSIDNEGIPPAEVAQQVLDAIHGDRFWILTHADWRGMPVERMQRATDQVNPTLGGA
jgi:NAD(P)-dependent dehydrogenase (short-subunit alcohol dehydrogenase family)